MVCLTLLALQKKIWALDLKFYFRILTDFDVRKWEQDLQSIKLLNYLPLYINYSIGLTLVILMFFYAVFETSGLRLDFSSFLRLQIGLSIFLIFKNFIQQSLFLLFTSSEASDYINRYFEWGNSVNGIISMPLLLVSYYTLQTGTLMLWITITIGISLYLYNISKTGWYMYSSMRLSPLFILVYLCSIEIMPVVWITGWLSNKI